ncbi:MAG: hypothetical protein ACREJV_09615, partial [Candidatus Rokuibacteriota bacterium]
MSGASAIAVRHRCDYSWAHIGESHGGPTVSSLAIAGPTSVNMPIPATGAATPFNYYMFSDQNYDHGANT